MTPPWTLRYAELDSTVFVDERWIIVGMVAVGLATVLSLVCLALGRGRPPAPPAWQTTARTLGAVVGIGTFATATVHALYVRHIDHSMAIVGWRAAGSAALGALVVGACFYLARRGASMMHLVALGVATLGAIGTWPAMSVASELEGWSMRDFDLDIKGVAESGFFESKARPAFHAGRSITFSPVTVESKQLLMFSSVTRRHETPLPSGFHTIDTTLTLESSTKTVDLTIAKPHVRVVRSIPIDVGRDEGSEALPLVVGNTWELGIRNEQSAGNVVGNLPSEKTDLGTLRISILRETSAGFVRSFEVETIRTGPGMGPDRKVSTVYGWNGTTRLAMNALAGSGDVLFADRVGDRGACSVTILPGYACTCEKAHGAFTIAGPTACRRSHDSAVAKAAEAVAFLMFVGLSPITADQSFVELRAAHH